MEWLSAHALEVLLATVVFLSSGGAGLTKRLRRQLQESRQESRKLRTELGRLRREHELSLEFNLKDRWTIRELAKMVRDARRRLGDPEGDILLEVYEMAEAELRARRLSASVHSTSSSDIQDFLSNE
jgi:hypothetical protein